MEMSLDFIEDLLTGNAPSLTVYRSITPGKPETLSVLLGSAPSIYQLELQLDGENRSWKISEMVTLPSYATLESLQKELASTKCLAAYSSDQLTLWPLESNK